MKHRLASVIVVFVITFALTGCDSTESDWKTTRAANTTAAYTGFLAKHPHGAHVGEARAAIDDLDWSSAKLQNTTTAYNDYLVKHKSGKHPDEARAAIDDLAWDSTKAQNIASGYSDYLVKYPAGRHADDARAALEYVQVFAPTMFAQFAGEYSMQSDAKDMHILHLSSLHARLIALRGDGGEKGIPLKSEKMVDGKLETKDFGTIIVKQTQFPITRPTYWIMQCQQDKLNQYVER